MSKGKATATPTLAEELERLEALVRRLEQDDTDLDEALVLFEEGVRRLRTARERLAGAEARVKQVLEQADGDLGVENLDV
ncbi:MAG TPA: exodeoxyribonuclease VII small subunit [Gemmatimonadales bacterium]|jgi:exodeoxyribonuclease VII small subunit|nr:exodeoxyribonuclease VII small subunit [Gemmatimonadales bacterium]